MPSCSNPKEIAVSRPASVATTITEGSSLVAEHDKREALRRLVRTQKVQNALISATASGTWTSCTNR